MRPSLIAERLELMLVHPLVLPDLLQTNDIGIERLENPRDLAADVAASNGAKTALDIISQDLERFRHSAAVQVGCRSAVTAWRNRVSRRPRRRQRPRR